MLCLFSRFCGCITYFVAAAALCAHTELHVRKTDSSFASILSYSYICAPIDSVKRTHAHIQSNFKILAEKKCHSNSKRVFSSFACHRAPSFSPSLCFNVWESVSFFASLYMFSQYEKLVQNERTEICMWWWPPRIVWMVIYFDSLRERWCSRWLGKKIFSYVEMDYVLVLFDMLFFACSFRFLFLKFRSNEITFKYFPLDAKEAVCNATAPLFINILEWYEI